MIGAFSSPEHMIAQHRAYERDEKIRTIYDKHFPTFDPTSHDRFLQEVAAEFGWTFEQAYIATEPYFRPENTN